jgi:hypothetical protein
MAVVNFRKHFPQLRASDTLVAYVATPPALTAAASVGVPTKVEFDKVVADAVVIRATQAEIVAALKTAGLMPTS